MLERSMQETNKVEGGRGERGRNNSAHQAWGAAVAMISAVVCLYWGFAYRRLER